MKRIYSIAPYGMKGILVEIEANLSRHLPKIIIVGLPDAAVCEAKERIWAAIENSGFSFPRQKVVINLAPAQIKKEGGSYDLPMAIAILLASGLIKNVSNRSAFIGELSLNGELKAVPGILVMVASLKKMGFQQVFLPSLNSKEASVVEGIDIFPVQNLLELVDYLNGNKELLPSPKTIFCPENFSQEVDMADIKGQIQAKRVLEIAASGGHNVLVL